MTNYVWDTRIDIYSKYSHKKNPCHECDHKQVGCHGSCDDYNEWKQIREEIKKDMHKHKDLNNYSHDVSQNYRDFLLKTKKASK